MELTLASSGGERRRLWRNLPWALILVALTISVLGVWNLASAARSSAHPVWRAQMSWLAIGAVVCVATAAFDYRQLLRFAYPIYGLVVVLLLAVALKGKSAMGAQRWLDFGPVHLQPSELMKIALIIVLARFYHEDQRHKDGYSLLDLWQPALLVGFPVALVMKQPDLGTAMMNTAIAGSMILFGRVRWKSLLVLGVGGIAAAVFAWLKVLKEYQKKRILTFLDPEGDVLGAGYHASQSLIAVGSGQEFGKGWGQGTQTQLSFLPEQHTDFIFSVWGEEHGFVGATILIALYLLFLLLAIGVAANARERFGTWMAVGVAAMFFWHVFINIGMVIGILPVVGVTLPLLSYGGSSMLTNMLGLGLLINVSMRRSVF